MYIPIVLLNSLRIWTVEVQVSRSFFILLHNSGIHQGCPLHPYLFIIVPEALNPVIKNAIKTGLIKGISLPQCNFQQIIIQYVDNASFTVRADETSVDNVVKILQNFGIVSCLEIN